MAFVKRLVGPSENLVGIARLHWIYAVQGLMWLAGMIALGGSCKILINSYVPMVSVIGTAIFWIALFLGALMFVLKFGKMLFTELALTSERLIYKRGLLFVDVREVDLEEIKSESVDHGLLGRIFDYGYLDMDARFIEDMDLPAISKPYVFLKAMNSVRTTIKEDSMRVVLDDGGGATAAEALKTRQERRNLQGKGPREHQLDATPADTQQSEENKDRAIRNDPNNNSAKQNIKDMADEAVSSVKALKSRTKNNHKSAQRAEEKPSNDGFQHDPKQHKADLKEELMDDFEEAEELPNGVDSIKK